jgi:hypothetical protein
MTIFQSNPPRVDRYRHKTLQVGNCMTAWPKYRSPRDVFRAGLKELSIRTIRG